MIFTCIAANLVIYSLPRVIIAGFNTEIADTHPHVALSIVKQTHPDTTALICVSAGLPKLFVICALATLAVLSRLAVESACTRSIDSYALACIV